MDDLKVPPQSIEAEQDVIGSLIMDGKLLSKVDLLPDDFYRTSHRTIYQVMLNLASENKDVDLITIVERLRLQDSLDAVGGLAYLSSVANSIVTTTRIKNHADIIKEHSHKRLILRLCHETIGRIDDYTVDDLISFIHARTSEVSTGRGGDIISARDIMKSMFKIIETRYENKDSGPSGVPSGFAEIDGMTDGFQPGQVYVLGARTGIGKSIFSLACCQNAGVPVGRIDLEMSEGQQGYRILSSLSSISMYKLRKGYIARNEWQALTRAASRMAELPIYFSFLSYTTVEVERIITQMVETKGIKMLVVDYLQLIMSSEKKKREQEVAEASRLMKRLAKTHNIPIIALAQLNRQVEARGDKRPTLSDLRESGQIEQDADVVMFLYREDPKKSGQCEVIFAKGRDIGYAVVKLYFDADTMTFKNDQSCDYEEIT